MRPSKLWIVLGIAVLGFGPLDFVDTAEAQSASRRRAQLHRRGSGRSGGSSYSRGRNAYRSRGRNANRSRGRSAYRSRGRDGYGYRGNYNNRRTNRYGYRYGRYPYYGGYGGYGGYSGSYGGYYGGYGGYLGGGYGYYPYYGYRSYGSPYYGRSVVVINDRGGYGGYRGAVRTEIKPENTEVYVDGYYAGVVDDFDGMFQRLYLEEGEHEIEFRLAGHRSHKQALFIDGGKTVKIRHQMAALAPGEAESPPPEPRRRPVLNSRDYRDDPRREPRPPRVTQRDLPRQVPDNDRPSPTAPNEPSEPAPAPEPRAPQQPERTMRTGSDMPRYGRLVVRAQPPDSEIWIDGQLWGSMEGLAEITIHLAAGRHEIEVRSQGYQGFRTTVDIDPSKPTPLNVQLNGGMKQL